MATSYPGSSDVFTEPTEPEGTPLSEAGTGSRNHYEHHRDLGDAVEAIEANAVLVDHDHNGTLDRHHGAKLVQANTHQSADTDTAVAAIHHTLGKGAWQAAAGNHVHSYNELLDRPYIVCTSTTRPTNPFIGMQIYETDTNTVRVWATFPTNPDATGITFFDEFNRGDLEDVLWTLHYHISDHGLFRIWYDLAHLDYHYWVRWDQVLTDNNWCLAHRTNEADQHTETDDQECEIDWGDDDFDHHHEYGEVDDAPCNDHHFRMSDDRLHYVRVAIFYKWIVVYATHNGADEEIILGTLFIPVWEPRIKWTIRLIGWECHIWRNGIYCGSIVDHDHFHHCGPSYRGWGFGCHVKGHSLGQWRPPPIIHCRCKDVVAYAGATRWGLLPVASVPILIAESDSRQEVRVGVDCVVRWGHLVLEWVHSHFFQSSDTEVTVAEPGVYHVHASICWDPSYTFHDHAMIAVKVNGQDVSRKNWEFIRGYSYAPGFSQTNELNFWWRFNAGDRLQVVARHNASRSCWLWFHDISPDKQVSHLELVYHTP